MRRAIAVLAGLFLSGSAIAQTTPNWALHYVPPPAEWNALWASKQDYNAPGVFTTLATVGNATITGNLTVTGTINGGGGSFLPLTGGTLSGNLTGTTSTFSSGVTAGGNTVANPFLQVNGNGTGQLGLQFRVAGANRWRYLVNGIESGGNTGSDFIIQNYTDAGSPNNLTVITRGSGLFTHNAQMSVHQHTTDNTTSQSALTGWLTVTGGGRNQLNRVGSSALADNTGYVPSLDPAWAAGTTYHIGDFANVTGELITATSSGVSGSTQPTCAPSIPTCSDGVISWAFVNAVGSAYQLIGGFAGGNLVSSYGGTVGAPIGTVFGFNSQANSTVANTATVVGYELNYGSVFPVLNRVGLQIVGGNAGASQGSVIDTAFRIAAQRNGAGGGSAPMRHLIDIGSGSQGLLLDPNGYVLRLYSAGWNEPAGVPTMMIGAGGFDLTELQPSGSGNFGGGFILRGPGSQILGSGDFQSNYALLHQTATGASLDASQFHVTSAALHSGGGGSGWVASGWLATCSDGSIIKTTSVSGGAVISVSLVLGSFNSAAPTNPVTCTSEQPTGGHDNAGNSSPPSVILVDMTATLANSGSPVLALGGSATVTAATAAVDTNTTQLATAAFVLGQAASATPLIDGTAAVGTSTRYARADHVHPTDTTRAALTGATFAGTLQIGSNTTQQVTQINGPAGVNRVLAWLTASSKRWQIYANSTAEGGANAGSDFQIQAFDDSGTLLTTPLTITRSTGLFNFATAVKFSGSNIVANGAIATTMTSLGPTGSHTTIQEWLTIQNSGGTTRYIPLY